MMRSFYAGVAGLRNHQIRMDVIGNNIANVNTIGFKKNRVTFADVLYQTIGAASAPQGGLGGTNPRQVGLGVGIASIDTFHTPGNIESTGRTEDLAIEGEGFFVLMGGDGERYVTRAGAFTLDTEGYLVSPGGYRLMGWQAVNGVINTDSQVPGIIQIPKGVEIPPRATAKLELGGNLDSRLASNHSIASPGSTITKTYKVTDSGGTEHDVTIQFTKVDELSWTWTASCTNPAMTVSIVDDQDIAQTPPATVHFGTDGMIRNGGNLMVKISEGGVDQRIKPDFYELTHKDNVRVTSIEVYDSQGNVHEVTIAFQKAADNRWIWSADCNSGTLEIYDTSGNLRQYGNVMFGTDGSLESADDFVIHIKNIPGVADIKLTPDFTKLTQYANISSANIEVQDGYPRGSLTSIDIDPHGVIYGLYSNGRHQALAQVAIGSFANVEGLIRVGQTMFRESSNSGELVIDKALTGGRGVIKSGSVEMSNVDLSQEFTDMIITQRGFQANSRVITTSDEMLQELVNLKR